MAYEFLYVSGSSISDLQSKINTYVYSGYNVVGNVYDMLGVYVQGVEKGKTSEITSSGSNFNPSYNYNNGINKGNNVELLSKNYRRKYGVVGNNITGSLTTAETSKYYGLS